MKYYSQNPIEWFWTRLTTERLASIICISFLDIRTHLFRVSLYSLLGGLVSGNNLMSLPSIFTLF